MSKATFGVLGAGAAGVAAAKTLRAAQPQAQIDLITRTGEPPFNRTLVNKGIAIGLLTAEQAILPETGSTLVQDTARSIDPHSRQVHFSSGDTRGYDGLIIATGSRPHALGESVLGRDEAIRTGRLTTLHSLSDARRVREVLTGARQPVRVLLLGGGLVAAETASLLIGAGHEVALIARSTPPGASVFGERIAQELLELHRNRVSLYLGRTPHAIRSHPEHLTVELDDGTRVEGDLAIVAHGTVPAAPSPWNGPEGVPVDERLRLREAPGQRIYAAGGVALHRHHEPVTYRIDHWDDAAAQGAHAARTLMHDLDLADDPGTYAPTSTFTASIHGHILTGAGHPGLGNDTHIESTDPLLVIHRRAEISVAATGLDAGALVHQWASHLHQSHKETYPPRV